MTLDELRERLETRALEAETMRATAPVADTLRWLLGELGTLNGTNGHPRPDTSRLDVLLTPAQVAERLRVSLRFVYAHRELLGGRALSKRALRFPETAITRYLARRP